MKSGGHERALVLSSRSASKSDEGIFVELYLCYINILYQYYKYVNSDFVGCLWYNFECNSKRGCVVSMVFAL